MNPKTLAVRLSAALLWCAASSLSAQALRNAPPPPPTDTEIELSKMSDLGQVMQKADQYKAAKDMRRYTYAMERLLALRPYSPTFMYRLAEAYAIQNEKTKAYDLLIKVQKQGLAINPGPDKDFDPIRGTPAPAAARALAAARCRAWPTPSSMRGLMPFWPAIGKCLRPPPCR